MELGKSRYSRRLLFVLVVLTASFTFTGCSDGTADNTNLDFSEGSTEVTTGDKPSQTVEELYESSKITNQKQWLKASFLETLRSVSWKIKGGSVLNFDANDNMYSLDFIFEKSFYAKYRLLDENTIEIDFYHSGNPRKFEIHKGEDSIKFVADEGDELELFPMEHLDFDNVDQSR